MPERVSDQVSVSKKSAARLITLLAIVIFVFSGWFWWTKVFMSQQKVFWGMIDNNLVTTGITRHVVQQNQTQALDQYIQLQFGSVNAVHTLVTLTQNDGQSNTSVKSETIGTPQTDYNRYLSIKTSQKNSKNQPIDTSNIIGIWSKSQQSTDIRSTNGQFFHQGILSIVPYGNFNQPTRSSLLQFIKDHNVYTLTGTAKSAKVNGHNAYVYNVSVDPAGYIATMTEYAKDLGLGDLGLDPSQYQGSPALKVEFSVDKISRQLVKINYTANKQEETFSAQGLESQIKEPTKTISLSELQSRIQATIK